MSEHDDFDPLLKARFDREHQHVPEDPFVATAMRRMRAERRLMAGLRTGLYAAVLLAVVPASPWLIAGAARLNAALASSIAWTAGLSGAWVLGVAAVATLVVARVRSR